VALATPSTASIGNYEEGQLTRFVSVEYKSDLRRDGSDYLSKNAEQEVSVKLGLNYQKDKKG
jgi:hypothetical protein